MRKTPRRRVPRRVRPEPLSAWSAPKIEISLAATVLMRREACLLEYHTPVTGAVEYAVAIEPGPKAGLLIVVDSARRDVVHAWEFETPEGHIVQRFFCPRCAEPTETIYLRGLNESGEVVQDGPSCQRCARLPSLSMGPWERAALCHRLASYSADP